MRGEIAARDHDVQMDIKSRWVNFEKSVKYMGEGVVLLEIAMESRVRWLKVRSISSSEELYSLQRTRFVRLTKRGRCWTRLSGSRKRC